MTIWTPDLTPFAGPLYLKLVKAIEQAIQDGTLPPETRLPTHRALADKLGLPSAPSPAPMARRSGAGCWPPGWGTAPGSRGSMRIRPTPG